MIDAQDSRNLGIFRVAVSLISVHYGLGFLLGTGEAVYNSGISGILYAISCGLGLLLLAILVPFYWRNREPIWNLLGSTYGKKVKEIVGTLSWVWMIGVVASQVLGATYILKTFGVPPIFGAVAITAIITLISLRSIGQLSVIFTVFLGVSSVAIAYSLLKIGNLTVIAEVASRTVPSVLASGPKTILGIMIPTVLITMLGMDFHQFIVQGKTSRKAVIGTVSAGLALLVIAFLPTAVVIAARNHNMFPIGIDGKETIPYILLNIGRTFGGQNVGYLLVATLLAAAVGSGSGLSRILIRTIQDSDILPKRYRKTSVAAAVNAILAIALALTGRSIISLVVCFYCVYVAGVAIVFSAYLLEKKRIFSFSANSVRFSLLFGTTTSFSILALSRLLVLPDNMTKNIEFWTITLGIIAASLPLIFSPSRASTAAKGYQLSLVRNIVEIAIESARALQNTPK